ncbi:MAG: monovalent cation/H(+) antiporter subunit G, partial [Roseiflexus sp.]|nr:monovalent cation/H(+) antiporter subunit G [Roseiflexus sp.]MBO9366950.1 monovalent cation/H(+) antiporter subunit G [Roseiflexus sp.]
MIAIIQEIISIILMLIGVLLLMVAGIGVVRMPDIFLRMSAASKASSLGAG